MPGIDIRQLTLQRFIPLQQTPGLIPNDSRTSALASIHELITGQRSFGGAWGRHFSRGSQVEPWKLRFCGHLVASMWEPIGCMLQTFMASGNRSPIKRRMVGSTHSAEWSFTSWTATLNLFWYCRDHIQRQSQYRMSSVKQCKEIPKLTSLAEILNLPSGGKFTICD